MRGAEPRTMGQKFLVDAGTPPRGELDVRTDIELVAAINHGDAAAFEVLYYRYREWVVGLSFRFTQDSDAALDVLQETFLYLLRKFPGFRLTANLKTFLYPAVKNLSLAAQRKARRCQATEAELRQMENTAGADANWTGAADLQTALEGLSEQHREVLWLRFVDGLELAEIAEALEIPIGTAKSRLHNALTTLRNDPRIKEFFDR